MGQALSTPERADTHPDQPRWENPGGWGARHISDTAPFNLWDEKKRKYRMPERGLECDWCHEKFGGDSLSQPGFFTSIPTSSPPKPAPFTLGEVTWEDMTFPTPAQNAEILTALAPLAA
ncbi:hypothetical protein V496_10348, partial [Pseudogymnoascus sp. VKM F-4515 (FW-2607)]